MGPELTAPGVVAVVVASGPTPWLDEALASLAGQGYPNLSVLVIDVGADDATVARVATILPEAHVARMPKGTGFADAANKGLQMVEQVGHVLVCHDDVVLEPDAVQLLLEEAYRSNAGLTCPKFVMWDAPDRLASVGMGADRLGVVHQLVEPGELDQGQHDAAREVFVAPSGAVLVRTDLWRALGGFNPGAGRPGEDLDLCWRAQLAGARVVVAPQARARHLEARSKGLRRDDAGNPLAKRDEMTTGSEQHRLRTLWTCYSARSLVLVVPVVVVFTFAESLWALSHRKAAREVLGPFAALGGSLRSPRLLWAARRRTQRLRRVSDRALWKAQSHGSARLRTLVRLRLERGHELAWAAARAAAVLEGRNANESAGSPGPGSGPGGHQPPHGPDEPAPVVAALAGVTRTNWRVTAATACAVVLALFIGSRNVLSQPLPLVGQLPFLSGGVGSWWHEWWSGLGPGGLGGSSFAPPGLFFMGLVGAVSFGSTNFALHVLVLGPLALGPLGIYFAARRFGSQRGRLAATVIYAALPIPYNALSQGHWAGLIGYAASPWLLGSLCRLGGQAPYPFTHWDGAWARLISLGLLVALAASLAPAMLLLVPIIGLALLVGSLLTGRHQGGARFLFASLIATAVAFVGLAPWSVGLLRSSAALLGAPSGSAHTLSVSQLLRLQTGPYGGGALGWAVVAAAAVPLFIGRSWRMAWAARLWVVAFTCLSLAWAGSRGWFPVPQLELVLAPAGAALALAVAVGAASVEVDLSGYRFGWRQFAPAFGALAVVAASLPFLSWVGGGQWGLAESGAEASFAFPTASQGGDYRVLWVGEVGTIPLAQQGKSGDVAFATSLDGLPSASQLWAPDDAGSAHLVAQDLHWAEGNETTALGHLLASLAVRYVVVPRGVELADQADLPVINALARQVDLVPVGTDSSYRVFSNSAWVPLFSVMAGSGPAGEVPPQVPEPAWVTANKLQQLDLAAALQLPVGGSDGRSFTIAARAPSPQVYGAVPDRSWQLRANGRAVVGGPTLGGGTAWALPVGEDDVTLSRAGSLGQQLADVLLLLGWGVALSAAFHRLRARWGDQLTMASLELGPPSADVSEIDWSAVLDGQSVG
ncbi:MAG TPA: glycosyltransferase [Acidimicrobiales bacterium]|nr:glycosyltransferase [Acidimicrobiales bacterium]